MPFDQKYDDTFLVAIQPAVTELNYDCIRNDQEPLTGDLVKQILDDIQGSIFVIADVSESNPNVLYETGYARGLKINVLQICCTSYKKIPFDIRNNETIPYKRGRTKILYKELSKNLQKMINKAL
jgi:hypothetical protein